MLGSPGRGCLVPTAIVTVLGGGDYLVMIEGTEDEINRAGSILRNRNIRNWNIYSVSYKGQNYTSDVAPPIGRASDIYEQIMNASKR